MHVQAFRLAEELSLPVMVCMDGFALTHAYEAVDLPTQEQVDAFLPPFEPRQVLDPDDPVTIGAMVGPRHSPRCATLFYAKQMEALDAIPAIAGARSPWSVRARLGRTGAAYRSGDAETVVVALGSVFGTIEEVVDELREEGMKIGALGISCFRPYPLDEVRSALQNAKRVIVLEKAFAVDQRHRRAERAPRTDRSFLPRSSTSSRGSAAGRSRSARCGRWSRTCSTGVSTA